MNRKNRRASKKLTLSPETLRNLSEAQLTKVVGGNFTDNTECTFCCPILGP